MFEDLQREEEAESPEEEKQEEEKVIHVSLKKDELYHVAPDDEKLGEEFGLTPPFPPERLDIMKARCASHGYTLEVS